ncbi:hypothetical protein QR77_38045 [Streptomyces sp. 150FB]|uniref:ATP-grasp domain-containing protein n=1 Tax=Streptomyces sp. 150FB TaxID=1576605 RepID=UPI0005891938|nr:ATP-grasp domain-containing protein [Streptomyces sp. 150FB]KIF78051.1 hypothetical protein QR77_38045 [Streptomyces sp. 150FB]
MLILGGGGELHPRARAIRPDLRTSVVCQQQTVPYLQQPDRIQRLVVLPAGASTAEWLAAARYIDQIDPVDRMVNYTEYDTDKTAAISEDLGLPAPSRDTYRYVSDKCAMRARLAAAGIDDTPAALVSTESEVRRFAESAGYPLICKPVSGVGSRGVSLIRSCDDIPTALRGGAEAAHTLDVTALMVERFHEGQEFSVEAFSDRGRHLVACVTEKHIEPTRFVELGHVLPAPLPTGSQDLVEKTVTDMLSALGVENGVTHTEVILTDGVVRIVETHLRPAGDKIPKMLAHVSRIDLVDALARQSLGLEAFEDVLAARRRFGSGPATYAAIWYASSDAGGRVDAVDGVEEARGMDGVVEVSVDVRAGDRLSPLTMSRDRPAHAWAVGDAPEEALQRARAAVGVLRFHVSA